MIMSWLGCKWFRLGQTLHDGEQEKCKTWSGMFEVLNEKFKLQHNKTMLSLQYFKLGGEERECLKEWMGHLKVKANHANIRKETVD